MLFYIIGGIIIIFILYLLIDFAMVGGSLNKFFDKWVVKTLWIWLPFYALRKLLKELGSKK